MSNSKVLLAIFSIISSIRYKENQYFKKIIDKEEALLRAGNDWEMLSLMVAIYFDFSKKQLILLDDAVKNINLIEINSIAHTLRGLSKCTST